MHIQYEIPGCLGYDPKALTYKATMHKLKSMFFSQLTWLSNNLVLTSYLSGIYLESWFFWLWCGVQKTSKKRRKQTEEKHWKVRRKKNEEYEETEITTIYKLVSCYILLENMIWKKVVYTIKFYLQFLCIARYLKHSNDTPNRDIHKYRNYKIIEIYINRLSTTTQIFIAMDYLITMSEKFLFTILEEKKNIWQGHFLPTP